MKLIFLHSQVRLVGSALNDFFFHESRMALLSDRSDHFAAVAPSAAPVRDTHRQSKCLIMSLKSKDDAMLK